MALNPDIQKECQKEVDEFFDGPENNSIEGVTMEALSGNLKLVERCILETLRLFPPIFALSRKLETPLKINWKDQDYLLPVGTNVVVSPYLLHRKHELYPEPEIFNPNRFLPEECAKRCAYSFVPFSAGPRNCIGLKFAMMQMKMIAAYTLRSFFLTTTDKLEDVVLLPYMTTTPSKDFTFHMERRDVCIK